MDNATRLKNWASRIDAIKQRVQDGEFNVAEMEQMNAMLTHLEQLVDRYQKLQKSD